MPETQEIPVCGLDGRCMRFKHFYPLLAFLIPTTLIGYGVVIPRSCIAGVNQLSVGFASTLLGTVIAYWQGIRIALRKKREVREKHNAAILIHRAAGKSFKIVLEICFGLRGRHGFLRETCLSSHH
jgi:hypothetical protein